ncbi:hypothetical protein FISHEDRAFT_45771 [Fistulina hepatica ATCC 64428]|uniref:Protein kinase domain-containing protein n=1 Tax=Fistulina hepatica ATCC 64428 TaxID=1128425 RepID=A0A0D7AB85_9AGAR|nr:hypothetical protein FISHEDRAFT_45771 [Fistulina hepatica ATCC 64428]
MSFIRPHEYVWRDIQPLLQERGYMLRPRYHKGHKLGRRSFLNRAQNCLLPCFYFPKPKFEDHIFLLQSHVLDARRMSDNMPVMLKVLDGPLQYGDLGLLKLLSSPEMKDDPRNHCVSLLDILFLSQNIIIIVLPVLKDWDSPPFEKVGQVLDFVLQIAETVDFLHEHNIAHGDLYTNNIMMDGSPLHPQQFHPIDYWRTPDGQRLTPTLSRSQVPRVQYYIIDFGNSIMFPSFEHRRPLRARVGADHSAPELAAYPGKLEPWDVFKLDIYTFGNFIRTRLIQVRLSLRSPHLSCLLCSICRNIATWTFLSL